MCLIYDVESPYFQIRRQIFDQLIQEQETVQEDAEEIFLSFFSHSPLRTFLPFSTLSA